MNKVIELDEHQFATAQNGILLAKREVL